MIRRSGYGSGYVLRHSSRSGTRVTGYTSFGDTHGICHDSEIGLQIRNLRTLRIGLYVTVPDREFGLRSFGDTHGDPYGSGLDLRHRLDWAYGPLATQIAQHLSFFSFLSFLLSLEF